MTHFLCVLAGAGIGLALSALFVCARLCDDMALVQEQLLDEAAYRDDREREVRRRLGYCEASALLGSPAGGLRGEDGPC